MALEPHIVDRERSGWIEVICGSMFSGKTEELIRRLKRARIARQRVAIFKPAIDVRFSAAELVSHDENALSSTVVHAAEQILLLGADAAVIGIDEAQFFTNELVEVCEELARQGRRVIVAGLDQDYLGRPFEPVPQLMAVAEHVTKLHAVCMVCGAPANHSQRLVAGEGRVLLGASETYEPRCRHCFTPGAELLPADSASADTETTSAADTGSATRATAGAPDASLSVPSSSPPSADRPPAELCD